MKELTTDQLAKGKKVVLFAVPGAFTPTCSMKHLPGFIEKAEEIKVRGGGGGRSIEHPHG
jgi:peroxiredoxin